MCDFCGKPVTSVVVAFLKKGKHRFEVCGKCIGKAQGHKANLEKKTYDEQVKYLEELRADLS